MRIILRPPFLARNALKLRQAHLIPTPSFGRCGIAEDREGALYAENTRSIVPVDGEIKTEIPAYGLG
jgi:hypothetical protein